MCWCWCVGVEECLREAGTYGERDAVGSTLHHSIGVVSAVWYDSALPTIGDATHEVGGKVVVHQHRFQTLTHFFLSVNSTFIK